MAPKTTSTKGRKVGSKSVPKALRVYIALQKAGYSFEDATKIIEALTAENVL